MPFKIENIKPSNSFTNSSYRLNENANVKPPLADEDKNVKLLPNVASKPSNCFTDPYFQKF